MYFKVNMLGQFKHQANDAAQITAIRIADWKAVFLEQRAKGMMTWNAPFVELRSPNLFNLDSLIEKMRQTTDGNLHKLFYQCLRSYGSQESVLNDEWTPPPQLYGWTEVNPLLTWRSMPEI